jgi:hypothetical protein
MRKALLLLTIIAGMTLFGPDLSAEETLYVQSVKAKVMSAPAFKSATLGTVGKGHRFVVLGKERSWVRVRYDFQAGFVSALLLSPRPPMDRVALIRAGDSDIAQGVRRRASTYTSAAAARGLTADDRRRLNRDEKADYGSLEKIESFTLGHEDVAKFAAAAQ